METLSTLAWCREKALVQKKVTGQGKPKSFMEAIESTPVAQASEYGNINIISLLHRELTALNLEAHPPEAKGEEEEGGNG